MCARAGAASAACSELKLNLIEGIVVVVETRTTRTVIIICFAPIHLPRSLIAPQL